jgi:uncharacterized membrane protein YeaQ/YmgE (transglycosylase-associated protein family)
LHLIVFIVIGLSAGALAGLVVRGHGYGVVGDIVVGVIGACLGGRMSTALLGIAGGRFLMTLQNIRIR